MSNLFAFGRVLTAFFRLCGTNVHREQKKALFLITTDNQWLREGCFLSKCKGSTIEALLAGKFGIENGDFLRGESAYATGSIGLHNVEYRPTLHGASAEAPRDIVFRTIKKRKIMSRFFGIGGKGEEVRQTPPSTPTLDGEKTPSILPLKGRCLEVCSEACTRLPSPRREPPTFLPAHKVATAIKLSACGLVL